MNDDIRRIFFAECEESLEMVEQALSMDSMDGETINSVFRAIHSIKGGAGAFGFSDLHRFTHQFETFSTLRGRERWRWTAMSVRSSSLAQTRSQTMCGR